MRRSGSDGPRDWGRLLCAELVRTPTIGGMRLGKKAVAQMAASPEPAEVTTRGAGAMPPSRAPAPGLRHQSWADTRAVPGESLVLDLLAPTLETLTPLLAPRACLSGSISAVGSTSGAEFVPPERNSTNTTLPSGDVRSTRLAFFWEAAVRAFFWDASRMAFQAAGIASLPRASIPRKLSLASLRTYPSAHPDRARCRPATLARRTTRVRSEIVKGPTVFR